VSSGRAAADPGAAARRPRSRRSPLHAARAGVGGAWCLALGSVPLVCEHPLALAVVLAVEVAAAAAAGLLRELRRMAAWSVPFALLVMAINALVSRQGATVIFRGPDLPWPGPLDITWEALAYGGVLGLRMLAIFASAAFLGAAVDADELLRGLRRASLRSGVTAALAVRLGPVLARDAQRLADAQKCLPGGGASRVAVLRAVTAGALDRATDVAATLEVRGFGVARRPPRMPRPWSRHDIAFTASALALALFSAGVLADAWATFEPYPRLSAPLGAATLAAIAALALSALLPFADRRGIAR
jgi:energy-coupling factor transport system permease protein